VLGLFIEMGPDSISDFRWIPPLMHIFFLVLIAIISYFIFKSKLKTIYKATYLVVPVAVFLVTLGILLYQQPPVLYPLGFVLCLGVLYFFYRKRLPWLYYFSFIFISLALTVFTLLGGEL